MQFIDDHFQFSDIFEISIFGKFLERVDVLCLKNEIKNDHGVVLVQAEKTLTDNLIRNLQSRTDLTKEPYCLTNSENLKMAIVNKIAKEFQKRLDLSDYSFCSFLLYNKTIDIRRIIRGSLNNPFFLGFITDLFINNYHITDHLIEISLISIGLLINVNDKSITYTDLIKLFQASILHDYKLVNNKHWEMEDIFNENIFHDRESAMAISDKNFAPEVSEIILSSNKLQNKYSSTNNDKWYNLIIELEIAILNLAEYYTFIKRLKENESEMKLVLYQLSLIAEKGFFPKQLLASFEIHFANYASIFKYGEQIGKIEKMCIMNVSLAAAYPKPKSTQLLCKNSSIPCEFRIYSQPLKVISEKKLGQNITEVLISGWYDKCKFGSFLPNPPKEIGLHP
jgi:hypothetical protein